MLDSADLVEELPNPVYKIVISEDAAEQMLFNSAVEMYVLPYERISPIVFYARLSDRDAIDLATQKDVEVTRAPEGWHI